MSFVVYCHECGRELQSWHKQHNPYTGQYEWLSDGTWYYCSWNCVKGPAQW